MLGAVNRWEWAPHKPVVTPFGIIANTYTNITPKQADRFKTSQKAQALWWITTSACLVLLVLAIKLFSDLANDNFPILWSLAKGLR